MVACLLGQDPGLSAITAIQCLLSLPHEDIRDHRSVVRLLGKSKSYLKPVSCGISVAKIVGGPTREFSPSGLDIEQADTDLWLCGYAVPPDDRQFASDHLV